MRMCLIQELAANQLSLTLDTAQMRTTCWRYRRRYNATDAHVVVEDTSNFVRIPKTMKAIINIPLWALFLLHLAIGGDCRQEESESKIDSENDYDHLPNLETIHVEDNVYVLDDTNYQSFIEQHPISLIEFYAPWCGHCKQLAPEFSKAAKMLQDDDNNRVVLAKIDASKFTEFARKLDVSGYPTMFVYQNGTKIEYDGPRTAQGIVDYMREISNPNYQLPEESVITLNETNFDQIIDQEPLILVEFYAPWCGHCKRLKPEYERAARRLSLIEKPIKLAKIDATQEKELAEKYEIKGYPTLLVFRNGKKSIYKGPRDENGIVDYMKQMQKMPSVLVETKDQLRKQIKPDIPTIVGFFSSSPDPEVFDFFIDIVYDQYDEDNHFVHIMDDDLLKQLKQKPNSLVLFLPLWFRSKFEPNNHRLEIDPFTMSVQDVVDWIRNHSVPMVGYRYSRTYSLYADRYPLVVVYYDVDFGFDHRKQTQLIREQVLMAAEQIKKTENITFVIANENENQQELKDLKLEDSGEDVNVGYYETPKKRFAMEPVEEFNHEKLIDFIHAVKQGKIQPIIRSQFIPETNPVDNLWTVVGDQFDHLVTETNGHDIFLEFYAPWCGHCQKLAPIYQELAKRFTDHSDRLRIAKLDASQNDFPEWFDVSGFPTLYYIRAEDTKKPIAYQGERTLEAMSKFIEDQLNRRSKTTEAKEEL